MIVTEAELTAWGRSIGAAVAEAFKDVTDPEPTVTALLLEGPLGAGKSTLARSIAAGAGVAGTLPSPTFNLVFCYEGGGGLGVVHADLYRLESASELDELGWEDLLHEGLVMVEWPGRAGGRVPSDHWVVSLGFVSGRPEVRELATQRAGSAPEWEPLVAGITARESA